VTEAGRGLGKHLQCEPTYTSQTRVTPVSTCKFINQVMKRMAGKQLWDIRPNVSV